MEPIHFHSDFVIINLKHAAHLFFIQTKQKLNAYEFVKEGLR